MLSGEVDSSADFILCVRTPGLAVSGICLHVCVWKEYADSSPNAKAVLSRSCILPPGDFTPGFSQLHVSVCSFVEEFGFAPHPSFLMRNLAPVREKRARPALEPSEGMPVLRRPANKNQRIKKSASRAEAAAAATQRCSSSINQQESVVQCSRAAVCEVTRSSGGGRRK